MRSTKAIPPAAIARARLKTIYPAKVRASPKTMRRVPMSQGLSLRKVVQALIEKAGHPLS